MSQKNIRFFTEDLDYRLPQKQLIRQWLVQTAGSENFRISELNYIFCSDAYLLQINREYLQHDTFTDIITFDNGGENNRIIGDIFISLERIRENALTFKVAEQDELHRVIIHGLLHLMGYTDKTSAAKKKMTAREDQALALRPLNLQNP